MMMGMSGEELMLLESHEKLKARLREVREKSHYNSLAVTHPDKWMDVAGRVFRGEAIRGIMKNANVGQYTVYQVRKQILDIRDEYKDFQIDSIDANIDAIDEITAEELERMRMEGVELDHAKAIKELNVAGQIMAQRRHKLADGADKVVRVEQVKTKEELAKELEEMFNANTIEAEIVE
jgi:hypothetical protein